MSLTKFRKPMIIVTMLLLFVFIFSSVSAQSLYQVSMSRTVDSTEVILGQQQDVKFNLSGPAIELDSDNNDGPKEIALIIDVSGSMDWDINGNTTSVSSKKRITMVKNAAKNFIDNIYNNSRNTKICIVPYSTNANETAGLKDVSTNRDNLKSIINNLKPKGSTNIGDGLRRAYWVLKNSPDSEAKKYVLLLTDGEPNEWTITSKYGSSYKLDDGDASYTKNESRGFYNSTEYPKTIGEEYIQKDNYTTFAIGFTNGTSKTRLEDIAIACGCKAVEGGNHYYYADSSDALDQIYEKIGTQIVEERPFGDASFNMLLPEGVQAVADSLPQGFTVSKDGARDKITGTISNIVLKRDTTGKYQMNPVDFNLRVIYTAKGQKVYTGSDCSLVYADPFGNNATIYPADLTVNVIQPVTGIKISGKEMIRVGESETYKAEVLPQNADSCEVKWSFTGDSSIADFDSSNGILKAKARGTVNVTATSVGLSINKENISNTKTVRIIDPKLNLMIFGNNTMLVNSSQTIDTTVDKTDVQETVTYVWSSSDNAIAEVDDSGKVRAKSDGSVVISCTASSFDLIGDSYSETKEIAIEVTRPQPYQININRTIDKTSVVLGSEQIIAYKLTGPEVAIQDTDEEKPMEIALVVDLSISMDTRDMDGNKTRLQVLKSALSNFVDKFKNKTKAKISIISYSTRSKKINDFLSPSIPAEYDRLINNISSMRTDEYTNIGDGLRKAYWTLNNSGTTASKYVLLLTDGEPNKYLWSDNQFYTGESDNISVLPKQNNVNDFTGNGLEYAKYIGENKIKAAGYSSFVIGFTSGAGNDNLNHIGQACGAAEIENGKHYYRADSAVDLDEVYNNIGDEIIASRSIDNAIYSELLPTGVDAVEYPAWLDKSTDAATGRVKLTGSISGLELRLNNNQMYELVSKEFTIKVKYDKKGQKVFSSPDSKLTYVDVFNNNCTAYANELSVKVTQPLSELSILGKEMLKVGGVETYSAVVTPEDADDVSVTWSSIENTNVADFDTHTAKLTAKERGSVTITATTNGFDKDGNKLTASKEVQVIDPKIGLSIVGSSSMNAPGNQTITKAIAPQDMKESTITYEWVSDNEAIAEVNSTGVVTAKAIGSAKITCTASGKNLLDNNVTESKDITITVSIPVTGVTINGETMMKKGTVEHYSATVTPEGAGGATLSKIGSDVTATFNVSTGNLEGLSRGTVTIKAVSDGVDASGNHVSATKDVQIIDPKINPSIAGSTTLKVWKSAEYNASKSPVDMQESTITYAWASSDTSVATVAAVAGNPSRAIVTTKTDGTVRIKCTVNGKDEMGNYVPEEYFELTIDVDDKVDIN